MTVTISQRQLDRLNEARLPGMEVPLLEHVRLAFPVDLALLGEAQALVAIRLALRRAGRHRLATLGEVCRYLDTMLVHGSFFDEDPLLPWAATALAQPRDAADRMQSLVADSLTWIGIAAGEDGRPAVRALVRARNLTSIGLASLRPVPDPADAGPLPDPALPPFEPAPPDATPAEVERAALRTLLCDLHPERVRAAGLAALDAALDAALAGAAALRLTTPLGRHVHAALCFLVGAGYARDPLHPWAAAVLAGAGDAEARAQALMAEAQAAIGRALEQMRQPPPARSLVHAAVHSPATMRG